MSTTCGFFNSMNKDRMYNATHFGHCFDGIILDGILASIGDCFVVKTAGGMNITVGSGKSWYLASWLENDADLPMSIDVSDVILSRIDAVVMDFNSNEIVRWNDIKIVKGTASSKPVPPTLIDTSTHKQIPLAFIEIPANSSEIKQSNITNVIGTDTCPFITGILQTISIDTLMGQWESQFDALFSQMEEQTEQAVEKTVIDGSVTRKKLADETVDYIDSKATPYNFLDNSDFTNPVNQRGSSSYDATSSAYWLDRWLFYGSDTTFSVGNKKLSGVNGGASTCGFYQRILAERLTAGKIYTLAVKAKVTGTWYLCYGENTSTVRENSEALEQNTDKIHTFSFTLPESSDDQYHFRLRALAEAATIEAEWIALYEGEYTADNLPAYRPKGYAEELLECQRYYYSASGYVAWTGYKSSTLYGFITLPTKMRITPSVTVLTIEVRGAGEVGDSASTATISSVGYGTFGNCIRLILSATGVASYQPVVVITQGLKVSSDL